MLAQRAIPLRDPALVMRLERLGCLHQSRLSFMRILTRRIAREKWSFGVHAFEIDKCGVGHAVYTATTADRTYSLVAFAHDLPADKRSDRVIAEAWDCTFCLFDGVPGDDDIERLRANVPLQEAGRVSERELSLSRANRSARLWSHVVERLANGQQPDVKMLNDVGYLMRTTAVYGSGKFGAADRCVTSERPEFQAPFQIEMLSVYLTRLFVRDLVQHMANMAGKDRAAQLDPVLAQGLGIGNSTGLGMAPFIINHPDLLNNWISARETALARVRSIGQADIADAALFRSLLQRAVLSVGNWASEHPIQVKKLAQLRADMGRLTDHVAQADLTQDQPWNRLYGWAEDHLGIDAQECLVSLMLEPYGDLVDDLADSMSSDCAGLAIDGAMPVADLKTVIKDAYGWALTLDWNAPHTIARAWYVSAEKLEPRLGERHAEPIAEYEQPLAPVRDICALMNSLQAQQDDAPIATLLSQHPEHRLAVRRVQQLMRLPYGEIRDNTIDGDLLPIDMLRCKLSFFGAQHFDPRSDRWVRISMFANAPYPGDLTVENSEFWAYPQAVQ